jgi:uncharacterized protein (DUF58 family)
MLLPLSQFPVPSGRRGGGEALRQRTHQVTPNASGVRDYAPGDGLNRIHWPSTARRRRLIAKEFELDPIADAWLLLDASQAVQASLPEPPSPRRQALIGRRFSLSPSTIEYGVTAAASIALYLLNRSQSVGLIAHGKVRQVIQADRGTAQLYRLLESLAVLEASGTLRIDEVLRVEQGQIPRGAAVILISSSSDLAVVDSLRQLRRGGLPPVLVCLDRESFGGSAGSSAVFEGARQAGIPARLLRCGEAIASNLERADRTRLPAAA